ncbi:hypothetical protein CL634_09020 [bacterium]|nr:hypothetical protein [bacterium]|tara:strand:- start:137 stop:496 length:360 start_codon:yes stop_codon:yes gene_type:complete
MRLSRLLLRKLILSEIKSVLSDKNKLNLIFGLLSSDDIIGKIEKIKKDYDVSILDDIINLETLEKDVSLLLSKLEDVEDSKLAELLGQIRNSITPSTFNRIKEIMVKERPSLSDLTQSM